MIGSPIVPQREAIVQPRHQSPVLRDEFTLAVFDADRLRIRYRRLPWGDRNAVVHMLSVIRGPVQDGIGTPRDLTEQ